MTAFSPPIFTVFYQGQVASGAKVYAYQTGTTTPVTTYSDAGLTTPNTNPIIADANGQVVFFIAATTAIRLDLYTSDGTFIRTLDPIYPAANYTSGGGAAEASIVAAATTDLGSTGSNLIAISGSTTITSFGASASTGNPLYNCRLTGAPLLTHNATSLILPGGANIQGQNGDAFLAEYLGSSNWKVLFYQAADTTKNHGQCRLTLSGGNLLLSPVNGNKLIIGRAQQAIPSAGVTLPATSLTPGTLYYIYAYMNSGTMTLEASTTGHATDATSGVEIKSADVTRTLVGMARPVTGPAWQSTATQRFVVSYFNRKGLSTLNTFTTTRTTTSAPYVELNTEIRNEFLTWADELVEMEAGGSATISSTQIGYCGIGFDGTTIAGTNSAAQAYTASATIPCSAAAKLALSEGYHYATFLGGVSSAATATYASNCTLLGKVMG